MNYTKRVLRTHLSNNNVEQELRRVIDNLAGSAKYIGDVIRSSTHGLAGTKNIYGEEQATLDVLADTIIRERLQFETSFHVQALASEEQGQIVQLKADSGRYSVTVDPLDGSSLLDANLSVGSIFGIHEGHLLDERTGRESLVAAMYVLYGPETTLVYTAGQGVHEFTLDGVGNWVLAQENLHLDGKRKIYSPGGKRSEWTTNHRDFINDIEKQGHTLRYSGALVADVNHLLKKGGGIFSYPAVQGKPEGKLRLLFELQPLAMIAEQAGGAATDGKEHILNLVPQQLDQRSPIYIGSHFEVDLAYQYLGLGK